MVLVISIVSYTPKPIPIIKAPFFQQAFEGLAFKQQESCCLRPAKAQETFLLFRAKTSVKHRIT